MSDEEITLMFVAAAKDVKLLKVLPNNNELLTLYKYYKQATVGQCNTIAPTMFNIKEYSKWNAWNSVKKLSKIDAKLKYIDQVATLIQKYGIN